jgi:putative transposase
VIRELRPKYPGLAVVRMCQLLNVPRSLVYRKGPDREVRACFYRELSAQIASVLFKYPGYGYRRIRRELGDRQVACGYKSVRKAMRDSGFVKKRPFKPRTSDGRGVLRPNLLCKVAVDGPGQAWVADITYIRLPGGYVYLACILDVFLRRIVGHRMGSRMDASLTLGALTDALAKYPPSPGWIHHSDRGSQYCSAEYVNAIRTTTPSWRASSKPSKQKKCGLRTTSHL